MRKNTKETKREQKMSPIVILHIAIFRVPHCNDLTYGERKSNIIFQCNADFAFKH